MVVSRAEQMDHDAVRQTVWRPRGVGLNFVPYRTGDISVKIVGYGYDDIVVIVECSLCEKKWDTTCSLLPNVFIQCSCVANRLYTEIIITLMPSHSHCILSTVRLSSVCFLSSCISSLCSVSPLTLLSVPPLSNLLIYPLLNDLEKHV